MPNKLIGRVRGGVVELPADASLADGAEVYIELVPPPRRLERGSPEALCACLGTWVGDPGELDRLLDEVQEMR